MEKYIKNYITDTIFVSLHQEKPDSSYTISLYNFYMNKLYDRVTFDIESTALGISEESADKPYRTSSMSGNILYDISGNPAGKFSDMLSPGIYIRNGKKYLIK